MVSTGCRWKKNFYEVDPGNFYRSAQLSPEELAEAVDRYGIKTVISLRGDFDEPWYPKELAAVKMLGLHFVSIPMHAELLPHREQLLELLRALDTSPRPILVHCKSGSDRTGEASAIYLMEYLNKPKAEAVDEALQLKYLHLRWFTPAKTYFFKIYQGKDWALWNYFPCLEDYEYYYDRSVYCSPVKPPALPLRPTGFLKFERNPELTNIVNF